ncbi:hypothetical protein DSD26_16405 [Bacillus velezensis]|nr:hypothetical protein TH57_08240 [Bacillus amyloliquefaciens]RBY98866.1 hypothetical protein DSD26_16405 [Bacillus velezensis]
MFSVTVRKAAEILISGRYFEKNPCDTAFDFLPEPPRRSTRIHFAIWTTRRKQAAQRPPLL